MIRDLMTRASMPSRLRAAEEHKRLDQKIIKPLCEHIERQTGIEINVIIDYDSCVISIPAIKGFDYITFRYYDTNLIRGYIEGVYSMIKVLNIKKSTVS